MLSIFIEINKYKLKSKKGRKLTFEGINAKIKIAADTWKNPLISDYVDFSL